MLSMDQCCCVGYLGHFKVISMGLSCAIGDFHSPHSLFNEKRFSRLFALPSYICLNVVFLELQTQEVQNTRLTVGFEHAEWFSSGPRVSKEDILAPF